ncbi:MAG: DUF1700 domain-containing protein [Alphaproteobacteria bacterium]
MAYDKTKLKIYLKELGKNLKPLPERDIEEILNEIESLILAGISNKDGQEDLEAVLTELGHPKTLAQQYKAHIELGKPLPLIVRIGRGTAKGASKSLKYFVALIGYAAALVFILVAIAKPFYPDTVGIWYGGGDSFIVGYPGAASGLDEVMGYWLIPFGLAVGGALAFLTRKIVRSMN